MELTFVLSALVSIFSLALVLIGIPAQKQKLIRIHDCTGKQTII